MELSAVADLFKDDPDYEFHPNGQTHTITKHDDYLFGVRANHFIFVDGANMFGQPMILMIANHKGNLMQKLIFKIPTNNENGLPY